MSKITFRGSTKALSAGKFSKAILFSFCVLSFIPSNSMAQEKLVFKDKITGNILSLFNDKGVLQIFDPDKPAGYAEYVHDHAANSDFFPRTYFYGMAQATSPYNYGFYVAEKHAVGTKQIPSFLGLSTNTDVKQSGSKQLAFYVSSSKALISTWTAEDAGSSSNPGLDLYIGGSRIDGSNSSLVISKAGKIGIGTSSPIYLLHLSGGAYSDGATWVNASSRELKENIENLPADSALASLDKLAPVTFNYKIDKQEKHVGFIAEDVPEIVATNDRKGLESMDIVAVLTKVVQEQQKTIAELQKRLAEVETNLAFKQDRKAVVSSLTRD